MVTTNFVPDVGELVWLEFDPQAGREQAGRRPALVLSSADYNRRAGLAVVFPVTSRQKGYPFEESLPAGLDIQGVALCDQVRSLDWRARKATRIEKVPPQVIKRVRHKIKILLRLS